MVELLGVIAAATLIGLISIAGVFAVLLGVVSVVALLGQMSVAGMLISAHSLKVLVGACCEKKAKK